MKKKIVAIVIAAAVIAAAVFGAFRFGLIGGGSVGSSSEGEAYVTKLSDYMGSSSSSYAPSVFMGVVQGQETTGITKSSEREIDEIFVAVGDSVKKGDKLFSYKTDSVQEEITSYGFDVEGYKLQIDEYNRQLTSLTNTLAKTQNAEERADLENEIEGINTSVKIAQNSIDKVNASITEAKKKLENSTVMANADGIITKIATEDNESTDGYFITMLASDELRVKGTINEQNVWSINLDEKVTLRSRVDSSKTWTGTITKIETDVNQDDSNSDSYSYSDSSSENSSTSYPFYVTLDSSEDLMMGQHLYIEIGESAEAEQTIDFTSGTYIYDYLIAYDEDGNPFVWAMGRGKKLVKKSITLGEYDEATGSYEVTDGVTYEDEIAYPMEDYTEGMTAISTSEGE